jgi:hypothetical protein
MYLKQKDIQTMLKAILCCSLSVACMNTYSQDTLRPSTHEIESKELLKNKNVTDDFEGISIITTSRTSEQKSSRAPDTVLLRIPFGLWEALM